MKLRRAQLLTCVALTTVAVLTPMASVADSNADPVSQAEEVTEQLALEESSTLNSPIALSGKLVMDDKKSAEGTIVTLNAWPTAEELDALEIGQEASVPTVGYAIANEQGDFDIRVSDWEAVEEHRGSDGYVSFEVSAIDEGEQFSHSFSSDVNINSGATTFSQESNGARTELSPAFSYGASYANQTDISNEESSGVEPNALNCGSTKVANYGNFWSNVGVGYSSSGVTMKFTYKRGQKSSLGIGLSATGSNGTFTAAGESSTSSTATVIYASATNWKAWQSQFSYAKFRYRCTEPQDNFVYDRYYARPTGFAGGGRVVQQSSYPTATKCVNVQAGITHVQDSTNAYKLNAGVLTSGPLGINMSAQTGFSSSASLAFKFNVNKRLCGTHGFPGVDSPGRLVAK